MADLTQFDLGSARRIAGVVRKVEQEPPRARPLTFDAAASPGKRAFRVCTFSGAWATGATKTVTLKYQTSTPNTLTAINLFWPIDDGSTRDCSVSRDGTAWFLLLPQIEVGTAVSDVTLGESLEFTRINVPRLGSAATVSISLPTLEDEEGCALAARLTEADLDDSIASTPLETDIGPQVLVHDEGCLRWAGLKKISVITAVALTESGLEFTRDEIWTFPDVNSSIEPTVIDTTDCPPPE